MRSRRARHSFDLDDTHSPLHASNSSASHPDSLSPRAKLFIGGILLWIGVWTLYTYHDAARGGGEVNGDMGGGEVTASPSAGVRGDSQLAAMRARVFDAASFRPKDPHVAGQYDAAAMRATPEHVPGAAAGAGRVQVQHAHGGDVYSPGVHDTLPPLEGLHTAEELRGVGAPVKHQDAEAAKTVHTPGTQEADAFDFYAPQAVAGQDQANAPTNVDAHKHFVPDNGPADHDLMPNVETGVVDEELKKFLDEVEWMNGAQEDEDDQAAWAAQQERIAKLAAMRKERLQANLAEERALYAKLKLGPVKPVPGRWDSNEGFDCQITYDSDDKIVEWAPSSDFAPSECKEAEFSSIEKELVVDRGCDGTLLAVVPNPHIDLERNLNVGPAVHSMFPTFERFWKRHCDDPHFLGRCSPAADLQYVTFWDHHQPIDLNAGYWLARVVGPGDHVNVTHEETIITICVPKAATTAHHDKLTRENNLLVHGTEDDGDKTVEDVKTHLLTRAPAGDNDQASKNPWIEQPLHGHARHNYNFHVRHIPDMYLYEVRRHLFTLHKMNPYGALDDVGATLEDLSEDDEMDSVVHPGADEHWDEIDFDDSKFADMTVHDEHDMPPELVQAPGFGEGEGAPHMPMDLDSQGQPKHDVIDNMHEWDMPEGGSEGVPLEPLNLHDPALHAALPRDPTMMDHGEGAQDVHNTPQYWDPAADAGHGAADDLKTNTAHAASRRLLAAEDAPSAGAGAEDLGAKGEDEGKAAPSPQQGAEASQAGSGDESHEPKKKHEPLNVVVLFIDSLSHAHFRRALPKTLKVLMETAPQLKHAHRSFEFNRFGSLGEDTDAFLASFFASVDYILTPQDLTWLWQLYQSRGYMTAYLEEECPANQNTLARLLAGNGAEQTEELSVDAIETTLAVSKHVADHVLSDIMCPVQELLRSSDFHTFNQDLCFAGKRMHNHLLDYMRQMFANYDDAVGKFVFANLREAKEPSLQRVATMDEDLAAYLRELMQTQDNTMVVTVSNHGIGYGEYFSMNNAAKVEYRLPALYVTMPQSFLDKYPEASKNLAANQNKLVSPYDLHATLRHVLTYPHSHVFTHLNELEMRGDVYPGNSVFDEITAQRTCESANIDMNMCPCNEWEPIKGAGSDGYYARLAQFAVDELNRLNGASETSTCHTIKLDKIVTVERQSVVEHVQQLRMTLDVLALAPGGKDSSERTLVVHLRERDQLVRNVKLPGLMRIVIGGSMQHDHAQVYFAHPHLVHVKDGFPRMAQFWDFPEQTPLRIHWLTPDKKVVTDRYTIPKGEFVTWQAYNNFVDPAKSATSGNGTAPAPDHVPDSQLGTWYAFLREETDEEQKEAERQGGVVPTPDAASLDPDKAQAVAYVTSSFAKVPDSEVARFWEWSSAEQSKGPAIDKECSDHPSGGCVC